MFGRVALTRRESCVLACAAFTIGQLWLPRFCWLEAEPQAAPNPSSPYANFADPPREYSPTPYWFWNGKLNGEELARQVDEMVSQHVYSAIMFPMMGLETPYLSEEWFQAMGAVLAEARKQNFTLNFDDEFAWPNGAARDIWSPWSQDARYFQSRTLKENPNYQMKSLAYVEREGRGGAPITIFSAACLVPLQGTENVPRLSI